MSQFDKIRQSVPSLRDASDEQILRDIAQTTKTNDGDVARVFGYGQDGGLASNRIGAGIDNYQANLYGLGEAVSGAVGLDGVSKTLGRRRQDNEFQANVSSQRAKELGGVDDWRDVDGVGSGLNYVGGLAAQSLPYLGEAAVGGLVTRGLMTGTRAALRGAQTVEAANTARTALNTGSMVGAATASYPSAVGDILSSQRDETGTTDLGAAALGGVPYAALNAVGVEGIVARGLRPISQGGGDLLKRVGVTAGTTAVTEGASETGQELINQYAGRMAVNPDETLFNDEANARYLDSFVGGAALGGVFGGAAGVRRPTNDGDLLKSAPPAPPPPPPKFENPGSLTGTAPADLMGDPMGGGMAALGARSELMAPGIEEELAAKAEAERLAAARKREINTEIERVKQEAIAKDQAEQQLTAERTARAKEFGVDLKGKTPLETFGMLEAALDAGTIDTKTFAQNMGLLAANKHGEVKKNLEAADVMGQLVELRSTGVLNDPMFKEAEQQIKDGQVKQVQKFIAGWTTNTGETNAAVTAATPGSAGTTAGSQPTTTKAAAIDTSAARPAAANQPGVAGGQPVRSAPVEAVQQPVAESPGTLSTVTVGRTGREQTLTKDELRVKLARAKEIDRQRYLDAMGLERDTDPTTGAPIYLQRTEPRSFDEVATMEAQRTGKKVSKQAIAQALQKFGITEDKINAAVGTTADTVSEAELGIDPAADGSGFRTETQLSKATGQGLVEGDAPLNKKQKAAVEAADELLKDTPAQDTEQAAVDPEVEARNAAIQAQNIAEMLGDPEADNAAADWDSSTVSWESLPDTLKADWVAEYVWNIKNNEGDLNFKELENAQANIERDFRTYQDIQAPARTSGAGDSRAGSGQGVVDGKQAAKPAVPAADAGSGKAAQKVNPAKEAWDRERAAVPQMPAFESLNERQQKQVADLISREQFNLAAANTVVGDTAAPATVADKAALDKLKAKLKKYEALVACLSGSK